MMFSRGKREKAHEFFLSQTWRIEPSFERSLMTKTSCRNGRTFEFLTCSMPLGICGAQLYAGMNRRIFGGMSGLQRGI
jgi:hypothetical protein